MIVPTIHLNGTSKERLLEDIEEAHQAICFAIEKLSASGPNERDYYPQGSAIFEQARTEHCSRLERLLSVRKELETLAEAIDTGGAK